MSDSQPNSGHKQNQLTFLEHLEVLRYLLMRVTIALVVGAVVVFSFRHFVFQEIMFASKDSDFFTYVKFCEFSHWLNDLFPNTFARDAICFSELNVEYLPGKLTGKVMTALQVSLIGAIILSFPYIIWEIWRFIKPALYPNEAKNAKGVVFFCSLLFLLGVLFGYYIINPLSVHFLITFDVGLLPGDVTDKYPMNSFLGIVASTSLAAGIMFELPIFVYFLSKVGLVTPEGMRKYRKHSFVAALLLAAVITPPDVFSQILICIPIVILYEISIHISRMVQRAKEKES